MSRSQSLLPLALVGATGFVFAAAILLATDPVDAAPCAPTVCAAAGKPPAGRSPKLSTGLTDEIAALAHVQIGLTRAADGKSYVWKRPHGRLAGLVQPTTTFRTSAGRLCRHVVVLLTTGARTARTEGIACRLDDGRWQLEG